MINITIYFYLHIVRFSAYVFFVLSASNVLWEDLLAECNDVLDKLVDLILILDLILVLRNRYQRRAETYSQVVWIHHVFVREFRQAV